VSWYDRHFWHHRHHDRDIESITIAELISGVTIVGARHMTITLNDLQSFALAIEADDAVGSAVPLPTGATVAFTSDNPAVLAVTANADGVTAAAKGVTPGSANVTAVLTLADGTTKFTSAPLAVSVIASAVTSIKIVAGTPA
jgi:hypothetical protein